MEPDGKRDGWGSNEWKGSNVGGLRKWDNETKIGISHVVSTLKLTTSNGDPMGLGYRGNHEIGKCRKEYKPNPLFPLNPPTNSCPKVPMISKENYSTIPMKSIPLGSRDPPSNTHSYQMGEGPHDCSSGGENGTLSYLEAARGCWLLVEDHLGRKFSPLYTTQRWWVTGEPLSEPICTFTHGPHVE